MLSIVSPRVMRRAAVALLRVPHLRSGVGIADLNLQSRTSGGKAYLVSAEQGCVFLCRL